VTRRDVVVSTFPPRRDGIGRYADQLAFELGTRREVIRIGLPGSSADRVVRLDGALRPLRLLRLTRRSDHVTLMWHPEFFISGRAWGRAAAYLSLGTVLRRRRVRVVVHEPDRDIRQRRGARRLADSLERSAQDWCWASGAEFSFHSRWEKARFESRFPHPASSRRLSILEHGKTFRPFAEATRTDARERFGWEQQATVFLAIGFLGRAKGFDRAVRAFARLPKGAAQLLIVGDRLYENSAEVGSYVRELRALTGAVPGARLEERFVEDEEFDLLIIAADAVLAPYRSAASSGVVARARLLRTPVIATQAGGLCEQLGPDDVLVRSDDELAEALLRFSSTRHHEMVV
jgi:glycosyltransferase involved in cell wall biosynthesis